MKHTSEKEFREKIRQQLEEKHAQNQDSMPEVEEFVSKKSPIDESFLWEETIKRQIEEEVYGSHDEFHRCINHLGEVKWLTSLELASSYEFYLDERGLLRRLFDRIYKKRAIPEELSEKLKEKIARYRAEIEFTAEERIEAFRKNVEDKKKEPSETITNLEKKILQEETDRFYSKLPEYKKYINHLGESKWMTEREASNQDEFMEEVPSPRDIFSKWAVRSLLVILPLFLIWFFFLNKQVVEKGYLLVTTDNATADLYINKQLVLSSHPNKVFQLSPEEYTISLVNNSYNITPAMEIVNVQSGDTVTVSFHLERKELENSGLVRIKSNIDNVNIFIDNEFQGKMSFNSHFILAAGRHTIALEKDNYTSLPNERIINISPNDTLNISFKLESGNRSKKSLGKASFFGIVEVNSNINGANIYIDGKKSPYKTDYIFQRLSPGQHVIRLEKEGYKIYPEEKSFKIDGNNKNVKINFTLTSLFRLIRIHTAPLKGDIFVDGKKVGNGLARVSLPVGKHILTFGDIKYYKRPEAREIIVGDNYETDININYVRDFYIQFSPKNVYPDAASGGINTGYLNKKEKFVRSKSPGPDIISVNDGKSEAWQLGYAYQYRNPPGSDAIEFGFNIPNNIKLSSPIRLRLYIYDSGKKYPLAMGGTSNYTILINNQLYKKNVIAKIPINKLKNGKYEEYMINHMLRNGYNKIRISTNEHTSVFVTLWKVVIK